MLFKKVPSEAGLCFPDSATDLLYPISEPWARQNAAIAWVGYGNTVLLRNWIPPGFSYLFVLDSSTKTVEWACRGERCYNYLWGFYYHQYCHRNKTFHFYYVYFNLFSQILGTDEALNIMTQIWEGSWINCTEERSLIRLLSAEVLKSARSL